MKRTEFKRFKTYPLAQGIYGGSATEMSNYWIDKINGFILKANYVVDKHYIWLSF